MGLDWSSIINTLIGVVFGGGITSLAMLKINKTKANAEARSSVNQEQAERIDLGDKYVTQMLAMLDKISEASEKGKNISENNYNESKDLFIRLDKKIDIVHEEVVGVKAEVSSIVSYLNGDYQAYKKNNDDEDTEK